ncbi:hypothetical protein Peur_031958 [Populus x canadensis]
MLVNSQVPCCASQFLSLMGGSCAVLQALFSTCKAHIVERELLQDNPPAANNNSPGYFLYCW